MFVINAGKPDAILFMGCTVMEKKPGAKRMEAVGGTYGIDAKSKEPYIAMAREYAEQKKAEYPERIYIIRERYEKFGHRRFKDVAQI